jgi:hypothetical protein
MLDDEVLPNEDLYYGLSSEKEMIAELANPRFREVLRRNNLLNNIIDSVKKIILKLFNKFRIGNSSTIEDNLIDSLNTLIDNFNTEMYNDWNSTRTA